MNDTRRRKIKKTIKELGTAKNYLDVAIESIRGISEWIEELLDAEEEAHDNLPESRQESEVAGKMEEAIDNLEEAMDVVKDKIEDPLSDVIYTLEADVLGVLEELVSSIDDAVEPLQEAAK